MRNLADAIERFIIGEFLQENENSLLVQRNLLAEKLACAPSQISYVLNTRFTPERGYMVESRRGSGGFVRIVRVVQQEAEHEMTALELVHQLEMQRLISKREEKLLQFMLQIIDVDEEQKKEILKQAIAGLSGSNQR